MSRKQKRPPLAARPVDVYRPVRRTWVISPATKLSHTAKGYQRSRVKRQVRQALEKEEV
ncbi:MAG: hypothetical protein NZT92_10015 [Abditibacteriales bacterium]|nr:hypothetical protein [Abditibacteriales bacterium]MDW8366295.1 hypothetical protein [Abditibacteriales bacterium]